MILTQGKTLQEVVDDIAAVMIQQGCLCLNDELCAYGNEQGEHCPVGHLLPEDREELMSSPQGVRGLCELYPDLGPNDQFIRDNIEAMEDLQRLHDGSAADNLITINKNPTNYEFDATPFIPFLELFVVRVVVSPLE